MSLFDHPVIAAQMEAARLRAEQEKAMSDFEIEKKGADFEVHRVPPRGEALDALLQDSLRRAKAAGLDKPSPEFSEVVDRVLAEREASRQAHDLVNHPPHYTAHPSGVECIQITEHMGFTLGNAVKYIWRADLKGDAIEDLKKARWYIDREIARREKARARTSS